MIIAFEKGKFYITGLVLFYDVSKYFYNQQSTLKPVIMYMHTSLTHILNMRLNEQNSVCLSSSISTRSVYVLFQAPNILILYLTLTPIWTLITLIYIGIVVMCAVNYAYLLQMLIGAFVIIWLRYDETDICSV